MCGRMKNTHTKPSPHSGDATVLCSIPLYSSVLLLILHSSSLRHTVFCLLSHSFFLLLFLFFLFCLLTLSCVYSTNTLYSLYILSHPLCLIYISSMSPSPSYLLYIAVLCCALPCTTVLYRALLCSTVLYSVRTPLSFLRI